MIKKRTLFLVLLTLLSGLPGCNSKDETPRSAAPATGKALSQDARTVIVCADEYYPYNGKQGEQPPGYVVELLREIYSGAGYRVKYRTVPWARAIRGARAGYYDAVIGAVIEEAPGFVFPKQSQGKVSDLFYTMKQSRWRYTNLKSLNHITLGVIRDYAYDTGIDRYIKKFGGHNSRLLVAHGEDPLSQLLQAIERGVIQAFITQPVILRAYLKRHGRSGFLNKLRVAGVAYPIADLYVAFSPQNKPRSRKLAAVLDKGMTRLRRSGRLRQILAKYGLQDWK